MGVELRAAITGIDGSGKSTVSRNVALQLGYEHRVLTVGRPTYSVEDGVLTNHFEGVISAVDLLHRQGDSRQDKRIVVTANTINVILQGRIIETWLARRINPDVIIGSRDHIIDPCVYSCIYLPNTSRFDYMKKLESIQRITGLKYRDIIFLLKVPPDLAVERINKRIQEENEQIKLGSRKKFKHMHEDVEHLSILQDEYIRTIEAAMRLNPQLEVFEIDALTNSAAQVSESIVSNIRPRIIKKQASR